MWHGSSSINNLTYLTKFYNICQPSEREEKTDGWYFFALTTEHMFAIIKNIRTDVRFSASVDCYGNCEMLYVFRIFEKKM